MHTLTANALFACVQYPRIVLFSTMLQFLVMYLGPRLNGDAVGPERSEADVEGQAEDGVEDVQEPGGDFDEVKEEADYADVEVVVCHATECVLAGVWWALLIPSPAV
jgi:hypothetical protein